jgi:hypothetical protein
MRPISRPGQLSTAGECADHGKSAENKAGYLKPKRMSHFARVLEGSPSGFYARTYISVAP